MCAFRKYGANHLPASYVIGIVGLQPVEFFLLVQGQFRTSSGGFMVRNAALGYWWVLMVFELAFYIGWILIPKSENSSTLHVVPLAARWSPVVVLVRTLAAARIRRSPAQLS
jgi:hypothetical protein